VFTSSLMMTGPTRLVTAIYQVVLDGTARSGPATTCQLSTTKQTPSLRLYLCVWPSVGWCICVYLLPARPSLKLNSCLLQSKH